MKKLLQVGALSLALLASLFMLSNHADAASTAGNVSLKINTGTSSCSVGGTGWTTNVGTASFAVQYVTGAINSNFSCTDYDGVYQWNMQIIMTSDLTGSNAGSTPIPRANVTMAAYANSVTA